MTKGYIKIIPDLSCKTINVEIKLSNDNTVWLTTCELADLFNVFAITIRRNLEIIFNNNEILKYKTTRTHQNSLNCDTTTFYNLDIIIALAFKINAPLCLQFRIWLREQIKQSIMREKKSILINLKTISTIN